MWTVFGGCVGALVGFMGGLKTIVAVYPLLEGQKLTPALSRAAQRQLGWLVPLFFGPGGGAWWMVPDYAFEPFLSAYGPILVLFYFLTVCSRVGSWVIARADDMGAPR
jgi:hypothetical protein